MEGEEPEERNLPPRNLPSSLRQTSRGARIPSNQNVPGEQPEPAEASREGLPSSDSQQPDLGETSRAPSRQPTIQFSREARSPSTETPPHYPSTTEPTASRTRPLHQYPSEGIDRIEEVDERDPSPSFLAVPSTTARQSSIRAVSQGISRDTLAVPPSLMVPSDTQFPRAISSRLPVQDTSQPFSRESRIINHLPSTMDANRGSAVERREFQRQESRISERASYVPTSSGFQRSDPQLIVGYQEDMDEDFPPPHSPSAEEQREYHRPLPEIRTQEPSQSFTRAQESAIRGSTISKDYMKLPGSLRDLGIGRFSITNKGYRRIPEKDLRSFSDLGARPSILLPQLQQNEKVFFKLVGSGNVVACQDFLHDHRGFNINCQNFQGVTALHIAVQNKDEAMVEFLLSQPSIDIGDNVLHAVRDNQLKLLQMLLDKMEEISPGLEFVGVMHSSDFADHITPLILACQCGHYEIIEYLIERGHRIMKPHSPDCTCDECKMRLIEEDMLHSETLRLNLYRAVSNPAYICHTSTDPIYTAFVLSVELHKCSFMCPQFRIAYSELSKEISAFAVDLIACCRSTEEMELILRQPAGLEAAIHYPYPRLILAMEFKQKEFVGHSNTQQLVQSAWHGDWHDWKTKNVFMKVFSVVIRPLLLPTIAVLCMVLPRHNLVKHYQIPINKMISHTAAYLIFLILIFIESNMDKTGQKRAPPDSGLELIIVVFVVGNIWSSLRAFAILGPKRYFKSLWRWNDIIMHTMFVLTFVFWLASLMDLKNNDQIDLERKYWHHLDPILVAEGTFAIAVILAYFRLLYLCRLNFYLGPLQISLGKMSADMGKYITIFVIIICAFTAGLCRLYQYYDGMVQVDDASGIKTAQVSSFVNFASTLKTFFWALFCMSALESADVIIENLPGESEKTTIINKHAFTEAIGYIAFALFEVLTVIMILNMLIATMSNTFQRVTDNVDVEWVFGKTDFYIEYMIQTTMPPPLNLLPTASGFGNCIDFLQFLVAHPDGRYSRCTPFHCCFIEKEPDEQLTTQYPILMAQLVQRYFREKDSNADNTGNEIDTIKQELVELKLLIREKG